MTTTPKVTVLMPVYNVAPYVYEAITSILNQTYQDFELLIINDGSTDSTRDVVLKFTDPRIHFVENEQNIGLANTLNKGIELAQGEYIARMDGDDISLPHRLEKQVAVLDQHPDIDICGAGYRFFGSKNFEVRYPKNHEGIKIGLLFGCCMIIPLFRKKRIMEAHLQYEQAFFPAEDYRFWTQCVMKLKLYNIPETLFLYRMHATQVSETMTNQPQMSDKVRSLYFKSLFPSASEEMVHEFITTFAGKAPITHPKDVAFYDEWANRLLEINHAQPLVNPVALKKQLHNHIRGKIRNFVLERWFESHYSIKRYLRLLFSGIYFILPLKFGIKLLIKSILNKKTKTNA
jgi:glycosyltransferase involved in cell wall biosynthesis